MGAGGEAQQAEGMTRFMVLHHEFPLTLNCSGEWGFASCLKSFGNVSQISPLAASDSCIVQGVVIRGSGEAEWSPGHGRGAIGIA
eukprot:4701292-Alexandrium_andersonii.AAC.1